MKIKNVYKIYNRGSNEVRALDGIDFSVDYGEFVSVIGSSGSGKSTLMNILGCLDMPDSGKYFLDGTDVSTLTSSQLSNIRGSKLGFVFQKFFLIASLSAVENVELPMLYNGVPAAKRRKIATDALESVGLSGRLEHKPNQLSGGQQQRVAIARAIAMNPQVILADEPTGNLDRAAGESIMQLLGRLNSEGKTVVLITHDNKTAAYAQRIVTVSDGKIRV